MTKIMKINNNQFSIFNFQFLLALYAMMLASCVNDLPYDAKIGAPKLVLNALLQPDSALTATASRTVHFLESEDPQRLSDATVTAMVNGTTYTLAYDDSTQSYYSAYTLRAGDEVVLTGDATYFSVSETDCSGAFYRSC